MSGIFAGVFLSPFAFPSNSLVSVVELFVVFWSWNFIASHVMLANFVVMYPPAMLFAFSYLVAGVIDIYFLAMIMFDIYLCCKWSNNTSKEIDQLISLKRDIFVSFFSCFTMLYYLTIQENKIVFRLNLVVSRTKYQFSPSDVMFSLC